LSHLYLHPHPFPSKKEKQTSFLCKLKYFIMYNPIGTFFKYSYQLYFNGPVVIFWALLACMDASRPECESLLDFKFG
jgi:hypothetical protein